MGKQYEIIIPIQKEMLFQKLKETTYPLCMENEAYRNQILSDFSNDCIRLRSSAGMMERRAILFEGTVTEEEYGVRIIGEFCILPRIKILAVCFLAAITAVPFFMGGFPMLLLFLPVDGLLLYLYRHLETVLNTESGDERIFQYIREELHGMIVQKNLSENVRESA